MLREESEPLRTLSVDVPESLYDTINTAVLRAKIEKRGKSRTTTRGIVIEALTQWCQSNDVEVFGRARDAA
jgi:hypothetical protein